MKTLLLLCAMLALAEDAGLKLLEDSATIRGEYMIITGKVRNESARSCKSARIKFNLYNRAEEQVGKAVQVMTDLEPGSIWSFRAVGHAPGGKRYKIISLDCVPSHN